MKRWLFLIVLLPVNLLAAWPEIKADRMAEVEAAFAQVYKKPATVDDDKGNQIPNPQTDAEFFELIIEKFLNEVTAAAAISTRVEAEKERAVQDVKNAGSVVEIKAKAEIEVRP